MTVITGTVTVIADVPVWPSLVAVIVVLPPLMAVTNPLPSTVATDGALDVQESARPVRTLLLASLNVAASCWVAVTPSAKTGIRRSHRHSRDWNWSDRDHRR